MVKDTIQVIKAAEAKAAKLVSDASEEGKRLMEQAKKEAAALREDAEKKRKEEAAGLDQKLSAEGEASLAESIRAVEAEIASLKKNAEGKTEKAIEMIVGELI